jgi:uncharacterized phiE125 gp8 family phage protein
MSVPVVVTPPAAEPFTVLEVKEWLQIKTTRQDARIADLIRAARVYTETKALSRALVTTTYDWSIDGFFDPARLQKVPRQIRDRWPPHHVSRIQTLPFLPVDEPIRLPLAPVSAIDEVTYLDTDGVEQTLASSVYALDSGRNEIYLADGEEWPETQEIRDSVTVRFTAGYGADPEDIPADIRQAMLFLVAHWYENRTAIDIADGFRLRDVPYTYAALVGGDEFMQVL